MNKEMLLNSALRAMLGTITPNIRAITLGFGPSKLELKAYFDYEPTEDDRERMEEITSNMAADFEVFTEITETLITSNAPARDLEKLNVWIYRRFEG